MASFIVLYTRPQDVEGFETYYRDTHMPLVRSWPNLADTRLTRMTGTPRGAEAPYHLIAEMRFTSPEGMVEALRSEPVRATGKDARAMCERFGVEATMLLGEDF